MIRLVWRSIFNQKSIFSLFIIGIMLVCTILPLAMVSLRESMVQVEDDITEHGRGSYDILIRPKGARTNIEKELGVVEENYLTVGNGGISIEEWEEIRNRADVEIAAPVASLGYFSGEQRTFSTWMPDQSVRVGVEFNTSDGVDVYPIDPHEDSVGIMLEQDEEENELRREEPFDILHKNDAMFVHGDPPSFMLPSTFHLVVGIDPLSEGQLTGINFDALDEFTDNLADSSVKELAGDGQVIPIMQLLDPSIPISANINWESLGITKDQTAEWKKELGLHEYDPLFLGEMDEVDALFEELLNYPPVEAEVIQVDFKDVLSPFNYDPLMISEDLHVQSDMDLSHHGSIGGLSQFYSVEPVNYLITDDVLSVRKVDEYKGIPSYREIKKQSGTTFDHRQIDSDPPFMLNPHKSYTIKEFQDDLSASPLGIYQMTPITLIKDENGKALDDPKEVYSTIYPGSFAPSPAHGVIDIMDAEFIKGGSPIDAIRIRVAGLDGYDEHAQGKIEEIAMDMLELNYEVDIVAGSSYQNIDVYVEGIGTVSQPWTSLGAAAALVDSWSVTTVLLSVMFGMIALLYIWNRLYFYRRRKAAEVHLLTQLGWGTNKIKQLIRLELGFLILFSWILSLIGIGAVYHIIDIDSIKQLFFWNAGFAAAGFIFMIGASDLRWHNFLDEDRTQGKATNHKPTRNKPNPSTIILAFKSIFYYRSYIASTFIQIILVGSLSIFVFLTLHATVQQTNVTMLGEYVNFNLNTFHFVMLGSAYVLGGITLIESLFSLFEFRKHEITILRSIGWKFKHIFIHWLRELSIWSSIAVILGHVIGLSVFLVYYPFHLNQLITVLYSIIIIFILIMAIGSIIVYRFLK